MNTQLEAELKTAIRDVPDFPKPGIVFKDIGPLLRNPTLFKKCIAEISKFAKEHKVDSIVGIESRGFLFGVPAALDSSVSFVPARKKGKLPGKVVSQSYQLEYGEDHIEMQADSIVAGQRYLVVDDVIATGGTAGTVGKLIEKQGGKLVGYSFVIELGFLAGVKALQNASPGAQFQTLYRV